MSEPLCLLSVHAHPDDESSKGAGTVARYHAEGVRTILVTCTGGEEGDILNPALDNEETKANLHDLRLRELDDAAKIIGYDEVVLLGYRDSGMEGTEANADSRSFAQAPLEEAVERLVRIIRTERPQVLITYEKDQKGYRHPDHLRVNEITEIAYIAAGDKTQFPDAGEAFAPLKLYYSASLGKRMINRHEKFLELGLESPYAERFKDGWFDNFADAEPPTTEIDLHGFENIRFDALRAHATQVDPLSPHWFGLPLEVEYELYCTDYFQLADSRVGPISQEDDLFAGVRERVSQNS